VVWGIVSRLVWGNGRLVSEGFDTRLVTQRVWVGVATETDEEDDDEEEEE